MAFPEAPRVLYGVNPLDEVLCQLRFPPILKIDADSLADFQERVRTDYPFYEKKPAVKLPPGLPAEFATALGMDMPNSGLHSHWFESKQHDWALALRRDALTLVCRT